MSWANQTRLLTLNLQSLKAELGQAFIALLKPLIVSLNSFISTLTKAISKFKEFVYALTGYSQESGSTGSIVTDTTDDITGGIENVGSAAEDTAEKIKAATKSLMGFDKINKLNDDSSSNISSGSGNTGTSGVISPIGDTSSTVSGINEVSDAIKELSDACQPTLNALKKLHDEGLKKLADFSYATLNDFYHDFLIPVGLWTLGEGLPRLFNITNDLLNDVDWSRLRTSLDGFYKALVPLTIFTFDAMLDFYEYFLKPLSVWTMSSGLPQLLDVTTSLLNDIDWSKLKGSLNNFWNALEPMAEASFQSLINLYRDFFAPIAKVTINNAIPEFLNGLADVAKAVDWSGYAENIDDLYKGLGDLCSLSVEKLSKDFKDFTSSISPSVSDAIGGFSGVLGKIGEALGAIKGPLSEILSYFVGNKLDELKFFIEAGGSCWKAIDGIYTSLKGICNLDIDGVFDGISKILSSFDNFEIPILDIRVGDIKGQVEDKFFEAASWLAGVEITPKQVHVIMGTTKEALIKSFNQVIDQIKNVTRYVYAGMGTTKDTLHKSWTTLTGATANVTRKVYASIATTRKTLQNGWNNLKGATSNITRTASLTVSTSTTWVKNKFTSLRNTIGSVFSKSNMSKCFSGIRDGFDNVLCLIKDTAKSPVNAVLKVLEKMANGWISAINGVFNILNKMSFDVPSWVPGVGNKHFGFNMKTLSSISLPKLAKGGIVDSEQMFIAGEAGKEAVMPLENNTGWITQLARDITGQMTIPQPQAPMLTNVKSTPADNGKLDKLLELMQVIISDNKDGKKEVVKNLKEIADKDITLDGNKITKTVVNNVNSETKSTGKSPFRGVVIA